MANFGGHAIPGTFFLLYGLWLTVKHTLQHNWRLKQPKGGQKMPPFFKRMDYFEGGLTIVAAFVGIMVEQFVIDGPHAHLYDSGNHKWVKLMNWQHSTMYLFFGISGGALVLTNVFRAVPMGVDRLALSLALFVEGFVFYFHVHLRPPLDAHIHSLLLVAVFGASGSTMVEVFMRDNLILELFRAGLFILQGTWFYQIGFVLYPLNGSQWDLTMHENIMFVTTCFCWHLAIAIFIVAAISFSVGIMAKRCAEKGRNIEIGMRSTLSNANSQKALLEESDEE